MIAWLEVLNEPNPEKAALWMRGWLEQNLSRMPPAGATVQLVGVWPLEPNVPNSPIIAMIDYWDEAVPHGELPLWLFDGLEAEPTKFLLVSLGNTDKPNIPAST